MKLLLLGDPHEPHIIKWATALEPQGVEVILFSFSRGDPGCYGRGSNITFYDCGFSNQLITGREGNLSKLLYLRVLPKLRRVIKHHRPDVVHAHYASGYGLIGALSGFRPFILSAWGSDITHFPYVSPLHRRMMVFILRRADAVLSTSHFMARKIQKLAGVNSWITPFGVDTTIFYDQNHRPGHKNSDPLVIGTIKKMKPEYSIHILVWAFKRLREKLPHQPLRLLLVGDGSERSRLEGLVSSLGLDDAVDFTGYLPYSRVAEYHNKLDIYVNVSRAESFGVSVLEASACGRPVVATGVGGLSEVVRQGVTGFLVDPDDSEQTARAVYRLIQDPALRSRMGQEGRAWVCRHYSLQSSLNTMLKVYNKFLSPK